MPGAPSRSKDENLIRETISIRPEHSREIDKLVKESYGELSRASVIRRALDAYLFNRNNPSNQISPDLKGAKK